MASDLGLHCLPMPHKKNARLIWVNRANHIIGKSCLGAMLQYLPHAAHSGSVARVLDWGFE